MAGMPAAMPKGDNTPPPEFLTTDGHPIHAREEVQPSIQIQEWNPQLFVPPWDHSPHPPPHDHGGAKGG